MFQKPAIMRSALKKWVKALKISFIEQIIKVSTRERTRSKARWRHRGMTLPLKHIWCVIVKKFLSDLPRPELCLEHPGLLAPVHTYFDDPRTWCQARLRRNSGPAVRAFVPRELSLHSTHVPAGSLCELSEAAGETQLCREGSFIRTPGYANELIKLFLKCLRQDWITHLHSPGKTFLWANTGFW